MKNLLEKITKIWQKTPDAFSRRDVEQVKFSQEVRDQFLLLKKKGLSIPIFTL